MKKKLLLLAILVLLVGMGIVLYLVTPLLIHQTVPRTPETLTLATGDFTAFALVFIAEEKGYFTDEGLTVTFKKFATGRDALVAAFAGKADIATSYETPAVRQIYEGKDVRIISTLQTSDTDTIIIARKDAGIQTGSDLKKKKIGLPKGTADEYFLDTYIENLGIKLSDVTIVDTAFNDMQAALHAKKLDAVVVGSPQSFPIRKSYTTDEIVILNSNLYTENAVLSGDTRVVQGKKEALTRLLRALARAEDLTTNNKEEAIRAVAKALPKVGEENIRASWDNSTFGLKLDNVLLTLLEREGQWFKDNGVYQGPLPDFRKSLFTDYLKAVRPASVTVF
jgi:ABC-type nitrate/sulfonate/bicarbonate transport system substrate-binding protein